MNHYELLKLSIKAALYAGTEILDFYNSSLIIQTKKDKTPLTQADINSNKIILKFLNKASLPIISEENTMFSYSVRKKWKAFWLVDPLDGTKDFLKKNNQFTVNIALVENNKPVIGVIYAPATGELFFGSKQTDSKKINICNQRINDIKIEDILLKSKKIMVTNSKYDYSIAISNSHQNNETEEYILNKKKLHKDLKIIRMGSSLKICKVAEGKISHYPRLGPTKEWDTAAGHAILNYAGGKLVDFNFKELKYNKKDIVNPNFITKTNRDVI